VRRARRLIVRVRWSRSVTVTLTFTASDPWRRSRVRAARVSFSGSALRPRRSDPNAFEASRDFPRRRRTTPVQARGQLTVTFVASCVLRSAVEEIATGPCSGATRQAAPLLPCDLRAHQLGRRGQGAARRGHALSGRGRRGRERQQDNHGKECRLHIRSNRWPHPRSRPRCGSGRVPALVALLHLSLGLERRQYPVQIIGLDVHGLGEL